MAHLGPDFSRMKQITGSGYDHFRAGLWSVCILLVSFCSYVLSSIFSFFFHCSRQNISFFNFQFKYVEVVAVALSCVAAGRAGGPELPVEPQDTPWATESCRQYSQKPGYANSPSVRPQMNGSRNWYILKGR